MSFYKNPVLLLACIACFCMPASASHRDSGSLPATALKPCGRFIMNQAHQLELIGSAAHFGIRFTGKECRLFVSLPDNAGHNYLQYEMDGIYQKKIRIEGKAAGQPINLSAPAGGMHTLWIYKNTEAHTGAIIIQKIEGENLQAMEEPAAPLIEFIGNSITCGAASDTSDTPCGTGDYHDHHNAYFAYGPRVARALGTRFVMSSVSGMGMYRNWNSDGPAMPQVYEQADFQEGNSQPWDFSLFTPQVVSIALGTNDLSQGDGIKKRLPFDSLRFTREYIKFVQLVRSKYPAAKIALLSSPMVKGDARILLQNCLAAIKSKLDALPLPGNPVVLYFFEPMEAHGCSGHPSVEDHAILARQLLPFFTKLLQ